ncbi:hypothetical protein [Microbacterium sp.]|uniref:hypothetical protein n=1 Tax=Microbacterium sp. TaxID=51671 RepID=UPI003565B5B7
MPPHADSDRIGLARGLAIAAYALAGVSVVAVNAALYALDPTSALIAIASVVTFFATAIASRRSRLVLSSGIKPVRPGWRDLWPSGLVTSPAYAATRIIALYAATMTATSVMGGATRSAALSASIAIAATALHALVPDIALRARDSSTSEVEPRLER